ncbi:MAG: hypothetical protein HQK89_07770 [Nitrospirae bacterium]|nr:hypothetical protein [Nitrospirota bacterium]
MVIDDKTGPPIKPFDGSVLIVDAKEVFWGTKINAHFTRVIQSPDGRRGYERFTTDARNWVAIIANWDAKEIGGIELLIKARDPKIDNNDVYYIIFISGATKEELLQKTFWALEEGANDIIIKPYTINGLNKKIEDLKANIDQYKEIRRNLKYAETYVRQQRYDYASQKLEIARNMPEAKLFAHRILYCEGIIYEQTGTARQAEQSYLKAIQAARYNLFAPAREALTAIYINSDKFDKALEQVNEAVNISPLNPRWKMLSGKILVAQKKEKEAKEVFRQVSEDHEYMKNKVEELCDKIDDIPQTLEDAMEFNTDNETAAKFIGKAQNSLIQGLFKEAINNYSLAADFDSKNRKGYYTAIAMANYKWYKGLKSSGDIPGAEKLLRASFLNLLDSIKIDTSFEPAMRLLARIFEIEEKSVDNVLERRELSLIEYHIKNYFKLK